MTSKNYVEIASKIALDIFYNDIGYGYDIDIADYGINSYEFNEFVFPNIPEEAYNDSYEEDGSFYAQGWFEYLYAIDEDAVYDVLDPENAELELKKIREIEEYRDSLLDSSEYQYELKDNVMIYPSGEQIDVAGYNEAKLIDYMKVSAIAKDVIINKSFELIDLNQDYDI